MLGGRSVLMLPWVEQGHLLRASQKSVDKELSSITQLTTLLLDKATAKCRNPNTNTTTKPPKHSTASAAPAVNWSKVLDNIKKCEAKLRALLAQRRRSGEQVLRLVNRSLTRALFLRSMTDLQAQNLIIADHLIRRGVGDPRGKPLHVVEELEVEDIVEMDIFERIRGIANEIRVGSLDSAIEWCVQRRSALRKLECSLEFQLKHLAFMTKLQEGKYVEAVHFARKYLAPFQKQHLKAIKSAMAMLAFSKTQVQQSLAGKEPTEHMQIDKQTNANANAKQDVSLKRKRSIMQAETVKEELEISELREKVAQEFMRYSNAVLGLGEKTELEIYVLSGLGALKSRRCSQAPTGQKATAFLRTVLPGHRCPCCHPLFSDIAVDLPYARRSQSQLICRVTGEVMNENNPPMALPNGQVISLKAMRKLSECSEFVRCPVTGESYCETDARKVFVL